MNSNYQKRYLDFAEGSYNWHVATERMPENKGFVNIAYGEDDIISHFCEMVNMMRHEFNINLRTDQVIRLAECTPGMTVFHHTQEPEDESEAEKYRAPINAKERIESHIVWKNLAK